ncbi:hypothetical protein Tco_1449152 [Tanacetum coccineum]
MAALESCPKHNMVAYLEKTEGNAQFHEIVDFLSRSLIFYALTVSPNVSTSLIEQFWNSAVSQTVNNVNQIKATVIGQTILISASSIRRDLLFNDDNGIDCLTVADIYENLPLMGSKSTSWDQFPTNVASAVICLATNRTFNFSKMIFDGMTRNLEAKKKFLMYLRRRLHFLGHVTPLFPTMLVPTAVEEGKGLVTHTEPQPTPSPTQPNVGDQTHVTESSSRPENTQNSRKTLEGTGGSEGDQVQLSHDSPLSGGHTSDRAEGGLNLEELFVLNYWEIQKLNAKLNTGEQNQQSFALSLSWAVLVVRVGSLTLNPSPPYALYTISPLKGTSGCVISKWEEL